MDEKLSEEAKPKITRSRARHIRRKRLLSARRAAEKETSDATIVERSNNLNGTENKKTTESLSKSKARRLRKRNKTEGIKSSEKNGENLTDNDNSGISECMNNTEEATAQLTNFKSENEISYGTKENNEYESITRESVSTRRKISEHELFENEKNLKITENSRFSPESQFSIEENYESGVITIDERTNESSEFIINAETIYDGIFESSVSLDRSEESSVIKETRISSLIEIAAAPTNDEVAFANSTIDTTNVTATTLSKNDKKMNLPEKTRDQVKAEREAKKAAKAAAKSKSSKISKLEINENSVVKKSNVDISMKKIDKEPKGDVVDGEISRMTCKLAITSTDRKKSIDTFAPRSIEATHETKSKSELRAERRAKQEAQRAAKQASEATKPSVINSMVEITRVATVELNKIDNSPRKIVKRAILKENAHEVNLFKHLYHEREQSMIKMPVVNSNIHPAIVRLGVQYADKVIVGSNARCVALLAAVKQLIEDFERPSQADFTRGLETSLQESSAYLHHCRPLAVSMQNALRHLKWQMTQLSATTSDEEAKTKLANAIDTYIREQIQLADKAISITIQTKISNGDVILTYGYSSLINKILCDAHDAGRQFRVVVVDGRPWLEGREQLRRLAKHGLECSYVLINALSFIMPEVSKVFLGAHAILANGAVMSRVGTAQVALMAKSFNVPVLVACETHKTCERVQTDSIVYNEIADADELAQNLMGSSKKTLLINWRGRKSLNLLNITYDVTPADLVTAVVTELAILPCTSVPVILRIKPSEI